MTVNWHSLTNPAEIRALLNDPEVRMDGRARQTLNRALSLIEGYWKGVKRRAYRGGVAKRDEQHDDFLTADDELDDALVALRKDYARGKITAGDARRRLQELAEQHRQLQAKHQAIVENDDMLEGIYATAPYEYGQTLLGDTRSGRNLSDKYPALRSARGANGEGVTLGNVVDLLSQDWDTDVSDLEAKFPVRQS